MTFVYCRRFGERVLIWSDFVTTHEADGTVESFPGVLKSVILNQRATIAFAGNIDNAILAIQKIKSEDFHERQILSLLRNASAISDFIFVSHSNKPKIFKISGNQIIEIYDETWIGSRQGAQIISEEMPNRFQCDDSIPNYMDLRELAISQSVQNSFSDQGFSHNNGVGNFYVQTICSPYGHCYETSSASLSFDSIDLLNGETPTQRYNRSVGATELKISKSGSLRGCAVFGVYFETAKTGFLYKPLSYDAFTHRGHEKLTEVTSREFHDRLAEEARQLGGSPEEIHFLD